MLLARVMTKPIVWLVAAVVLVAVGTFLLVVTPKESRVARVELGDPSHVKAIPSTLLVERARTAHDGTLDQSLPIELPRRDETSLMAELRNLSTTNPRASVELAREGNRRFPASDDAPERSHILVKSLVALGRFEEARDEATILVDTYRDTPWATDVERHLLTNPLTHPSERGFGKDKE